MHTPSVSERNGVQQLLEEDLKIYSVGISTAGEAEIRMVKGHPKRHVVATTIDHKGLEFAKKHVQAAGLSSQIAIKWEDVSDPLPYQTGEFDFVYARLVLHYLPKPLLIDSLEELRRILKKGGKCFVVVRSNQCQEVKDRYVDFDPETHMTTYQARGGLVQRYFHTEESICNYLKEAGFDIARVKTYEEHLCLDFQRTEPSDYVDSLIEVLAVNKGGK